MADGRPPTDWTEELIVQAAFSMDYPPTPDIAAVIRTRLAANAPLRRPAFPFPGPLVRALVAGAAVLSLGLAAILSASSGAREAIAEFLGLRVAGEQIAILTPPAAGETATPFPSPVALESYATPVPASGLASAVGFEPVYPPGYGDPDATYVVDYADVKVAVLQYEDFNLWEANLAGPEFDKRILFFGKGVAVLEELTVNDQPAYWIAGGGHIVRFVGADGTVVAGSERTVDRDTLVWRSATGVNYRLETGLALEDALAVAETLP